MATPYSRLLESYQAQDRLIRDRVERYISAAWAMASWRDADIDRFVAAVVPVVEAGQVQVAKLTDAYLAQVDQYVFGVRRPARTALAASDVSTGAVRGVPAAEVYRRPAVELYTALSNGRSLPDAVAAGLTRAHSLAATDLQLAKTTATQKRFGRDDGIAGYRRTLTGAENCAMCAIASTQRYHRADLMPIHPGCDCGISPIRGDRDPGQIINADLLEQTHAQVEGLAGSADRGARDIGLDTGRDYNQLLITSEHGEYGPTLRWRDQNFTGPSGVAA